MTITLLDVATRSRRLRWIRAAIVAGLLPTVAGCAAGTYRWPGEARRVAAPPTGARPVGPDRGGETRHDTLDLDPSRRAASSPGGRAIVRAAMQYVGTPYVWGGMSPSGFDCSGFVKYVYARLGIVLPRTVKEQYEVGAPVRRDGLRVGDIVFFDRLRHNGIYVGDDRLIHASKSGGTVEIASLDDAWFSRRWVGARRPRPVSEASRKPLPVSDSLR
jgi:cell wall-associated NlpC family hydrolase